MPLLLLVLIGIFQFGNIFYTRQIMVDVAREAARSYAVGESTAAQAQQLALDRLAAVSNLGFTATVSEPSGTNNDVTVTITVPTADAALVSNPLAGIFGG